MSLSTRIQRALEFLTTTPRGAWMVPADPPAEPLPATGPPDVRKNPRLLVGLGLVAFADAERLSSADLAERLGAPTPRSLAAPLRKVGIRPRSMRIHRGRSALWGHERQTFARACSALLPPGNPEEPLAFEEAASLLGLRPDAVESFRPRVPVVPGPPRPRDLPDFLEFRERYFGHESYWFHEDAWRRIEENKRLILLLPPGHTKTHFASIEQSAYRLIADPNYRILIIQKSQVEATKILGAVAERLSSHQFYERLGIPEEEDPITRWGPFRPETRAYREPGEWSRTALTVVGKTSGEKEPSLQAKGAESGILSIRADLIILDDIQEPTEDTPSGTEALLRWLKQAVVSRLYPEQKLVVIGSRLGPTDIYGRLLEDEEFSDWPRMPYPAILPACPKCTEAERECPHPEEDRMLWSGYPGGYEGLMSKKKEAGAFWLPTWMQEEGGFEDLVFKPDSLNAAKDPGLALGVVPPAVTDVFVGVDPAISKFCAIVAWGLDRRTGMRYLIDIFNKQGLGHWDRVVEEARLMAATYRAGKVCIELSNTQGAIHNNPRYRQELESVGARMVPYRTRTEMGAQARSDEFDISTIGTLFDRRLVRLPYGDPASREKVDRYCAQLINWRPSVKHLTRDMVMATLFAESEAATEYDRWSRRGPVKQGSNWDVPRFASNGRGGWGWQKPRKRSVFDRDQEE